MDGKKIETGNLEAPERRYYRIMLRISWVGQVTNLEVLRRIDKEEEIVMSIKMKKLEYIGHIIRSPKYKLLRKILEGTMEYEA